MISTESVTISCASGAASHNLMRRVTIMARIVVCITIGSGGAAAQQPAVGVGDRGPVMCKAESDVAIIVRVAERLGAEGMGVVQTAMMDEKRCYRAIPRVPVEVEMCRGKVWARVKRADTGEEAWSLLPELLSRSDIDRRLGMLALTGQRCSWAQ